MALTSDRVEGFEEKVHLVGFSLGGYIASCYAIKNPQNVASLTLVGYASDGLNKDEEAQRKQTVNVINKGLYKGMNKVRLAQFVHSSMLTDEDLVDYITTMNDDLGGQVLKAQILSTTPRPSITDKLTGLGFPIHIVSADEDKIAPPEKLEAMDEVFKNSKLHRVENAGHMMLLEQPDTLASVLKTILLKPTI